MVRYDKLILSHVLLLNTMDSAPLKLIGSGKSCAVNTMAQKRLSERLVTIANR